jgi:hypothetical protein
MGWVYDGRQGCSEYPAALNRSIAMVIQSFLGFWGRIQGNFLFFYDAVFRGAIFIALFFTFCAAAFWRGVRMAEL